ncbi:MAG: DinB family protein [Nitrososphaerales archaeon]
MLSIQELYQYSARVRRKFAEKLAQMPWDEINKNREASFHSMKNIMLHVIDNEDWMVNWVVKNKGKEYKREKKSDDYIDMKMVLDHLSDVENKTQLYLKGMTEDDLKARVRLTLSSGREFDLTVEECFLQSFTEQLYHLGELIALMWQENIEPPQMQWFYNNPREER